MLIAHQKERIDRTKKGQLETRGFHAYFWEVDHPLWDVIGVQDFGKANNYKPTWTQNYPSADPKDGFASCVGIKKIIESQRKHFVILKQMKLTEPI